MKLIMETWKAYLDEGVTDIVYHKTRLDLAADILKANKFMTSVAFGTPADKQQNKGKLYYLSTMRSPTGDYGPGLPAVTFKLDGRALGERSKAAAVDYWGPEFPKDEMEDRVFTDEPYLEPAVKYITEIHVGLPIGDKYRKMLPARIEEAEALLAGAESAGIPIYFYANQKTYGILNKTKRMSLDEWKQAFEEAGEELEEPYSGSYQAGPYTDRLLTGVVELIKGFEGGNVDDIDKGSKSEWYDIKYDSGGERARQIQNAVHNSKAEPEARDIINTIAQKVKELGGVQELVDWLQQEIKKHDAEPELRKVAENIFKNWRKFMEGVELDIEVGDIILGGKYKNKRIEVKEIGEDELGQPTINGKPILKFRMEKFLPDEKKSKKTLDAEKAAKEEESKDEI